MSQVEQENVEPEAEENPDPEEDTDWTTRHVNRDESAQELPLGTDEPEATSGLSATSDFDSKEKTEEAEPSITSGNHSEGQPMSNGSTLSPTVEDGSFEQDEEVAAPESETGIQHRTCSESDQQLLIPQSREECINSIAEESINEASGSSRPDEQFKKEINVSDEISDRPTLDDQKDSLHPSSAFTGNIEIEPGPDSEAPEDEIRTNIAASCVDMEAIQPPMDDALPRQSNDHGTSFVTSRSSSQDVSAESNPSGDGDKDSQTPECDRDSGRAFRSLSDVPLEESKLSSSNDKEEEDKVIHVVEVTKSNNSSESADQNPSDSSLSVSNADSDSGTSLNNQGYALPTLQRENVSESAVIAASQMESKSDLSCTVDSKSESPNPVKLSNQQSLPSVSQTSSLSSSPSNAASEKPSSHNCASSGSQKNQSPSNKPRKPEEDISSLSTNCAVLQTSHVSHHSPKTKTPISKDIQKQLQLALCDDDDDDAAIDDIMSELDAELLSSRSPSLLHQQRSPKKPSPNTRTLDRDDREMAPNGILASDIRQLQNHNRQLLQQLQIRDEEISNLTKERNSLKGELSLTQSERDDALRKLATSSSHNADDIYLPQITELEKTIVQQQDEIRYTKDKLASHDNAAKRAVTTLQNELKCRVDQVTKLYEEAIKEKDAIVIKFAASESKTMDNKKVLEKQDAKLKEALRERDQMASALKAAKADRQKALTNFEVKSNELANIHKELEKMKEAVSSSEYRIKWFQNKLKEELESHKETKATLEKTVIKLKEAKEETEIIRRECQAIVKTYQESEEIKSNSLDKELKIKDTQLKLRMQEFNDTEEIQRRTMKELEAIKAQHKDALEELKALKQKAASLEETTTEKELVIGQLHEAIEKHKTGNAKMQEKITAVENLEDDFSRAQDMIKSLDKDVVDLKITNRDLQKDMEACRERESKMLSLQSELSRTNALLRSENTTLSNKACNLTAEAEKLKMEVQELETTVKHLSDSCEEGKKKKTEEVDTLKKSLDEKTKESSDFKQKWEDEMDSNKTLKRRHANNVKDLTRQLHQAKRRLENMEGSKDGGSMGSRTNSNGSLNSMDNSSAHNPPQPQQEFPVITEQVEVDKHVLIERIVRLQKSHARKNEKLEFLSEHIHQLLEEIKKKNKIIQSYVLREEAGTLSSEDMDANKEEAQKEMQTLLARKGGIMASLYSVHQQDGHMTLELSLQINKKLQAVLEDTLLKNITLKENLDTLGEEIARLSQENRRLQLHLQDLEATSGGRKVKS